MTAHDADYHGLETSFGNPQLLHMALTHRSFRKDQPDEASNQPSNERLEFLGDAVLNFLTADWLYQHFPDYDEGELSGLRSALVRMTTLARFARGMGLGAYVRISRSEESRDARNRDALLADVFEALLGALYLDQGINAVQQFITPFLEQEAERVLAGQADIDYRTALQKLLQSRYGITPTYRTIGVSGPDHNRMFTVEVLKAEETLGIGQGSSKQAAAHAAARVALETLQASTSPTTPSF